MQRPTFLCCAFLSSSLAVLGCGTTRTTDTSRTAKEQLLISSAVDQAIARVEFGPLTGRGVYLDEQYLDCVDKKYVVGTVRQKIMQAGGHLAAKREDADLVVEMHSGALGTDREESKIGIPSVSLPLPMPVELPEVNIANRTRQTATAKLGLIAYDAKSGDAVAEGGRVLARSDDTNWYILGLGPLNAGSVRDEVASILSKGPEEERLALLEPASAPTRLASRPDRPPIGGTSPLPGSTPPDGPSAGGRRYEPRFPTGDLPDYDLRSPAGRP